MSDISRRQFLGLSGVVAAVAGLGLVGCGGTGDTAADSTGAAASTLSGSISCSGATSFQPLVEKAADAFMDANPDVSIAIAAGGSGQGLSQIAEGSVQIGRSDVYAEEKLEADQCEGLVDNQVCIVGMGPIVNPEVSVDDIAIADLAKIFTGEITNWSELGGEDAEIAVFGRDSASGTRSAFEEILGIEDQCAYLNEYSSTGDVIGNVASNPNAIGYASLSAVDESVAAVSVDGVIPTEETVADGTFAIQRPFVLVTKTDAPLSTAAQAFFDYATSTAANDLIKAAGAVPVAK